jgi:hypothetical protein
MLLKLPGLSTTADFAAGFGASSAAAALHSTKADGTSATPATNNAFNGKDAMRMTIPPLANHPGLKRLAGFFRDGSRAPPLRGEGGRSLKSETERPNFQNRFRSTRLRRL